MYAITNAPTARCETGKYARLIKATKSGEAMRRV